jgi:polyphenol oxidase
MISKADLIYPEWHQPACVHAFTSTRAGGVSAKPFDSLNLGLFAGDDIECVLQNRKLLNQHLPNEPIWLKQIHGNWVSTPQSRSISTNDLIEADASVTNIPHEVLAILTADCMPVLFASNHGEVIGAAHAGWRGLSNGVLENTVKAMLELAPQLNPSDITAWMGPAIGPTHFEIGPDVMDAFLNQKRGIPNGAFIAISRRPGKYLANLYLLARHRLMIAGISEVQGGGFCTFNDDSRFYSYRRDGVTGRFASLIWIAGN